MSVFKVLTKCSPVKVTQINPHDCLTVLYCTTYGGILNKKLRRSKYFCFEALIRAIKFNLKQKY